MPELADAIVEVLSHPSALLIPAILLLLAERGSHGYELLERLEDFGLVKGTAAVYRELRRMEDGGLVRSRWETSQTRGAARRVYELTDEGKRALAACTVGASQLSRTLDCYLDRARAVEP